MLGTTEVQLGLRQKNPGVKKQSGIGTREGRKNIGNSTMGLARLTWLKSKRVGNGLVDRAKVSKIIRHKSQSKTC